MFKHKNKKLKIGLAITAILTVLGGIGSLLNSTTAPNNSQTTNIEDSGSKESNQNQLSSEITGAFDFSFIPAYFGNHVVIVNDNKPFVTSADLSTKSMEYYSPLDELGRCGVCYAIVGQDIMPTEPRQDIGMIKPTGWVQGKYPDLIPDLYLYNRCHLLAYQNTGENANELNLITGTRQMNLEQIPYENQIADYVSSTNHHVFYRVTPIFIEDNLLASGVLLEAKSVEDDEVEFCVYVYNAQDGIDIDYTDGSNQVSKITENAAQDAADEKEAIQDYVLNSNSMKFHYPDCSSVEDIHDKNRIDYHGSRKDVIAKGYQPCKRCSP